LRVENPTLLQSPSVTIRVAQAGAGAPGGTGAAAPTVIAPPTSVAAPFLGNCKVYGRGFQVGATLTLTDLGTGAATTQGLLFVSPGEVWWPLLYPRPGSYEARIQNPGGAPGAAWPFTVR